MSWCLSGNIFFIMQKKEKLYFTIIITVSILIPIAVAFLLFIPQTGKLGKVDVSVLPHINAVLNSLTAILLITGFTFIKNHHQKYHMISMLSAFALSSAFLVSYVVYHYQAELTPYLGEGAIRPLYYILLISHISLAAVVVPFVLLAIYFAISQQFQRHRKIVKWTFPIWLYVAVSGVVVYLMISPYY